MEESDKICEACGGSRRAMEDLPAPGDTCAVRTFSLQCNVCIMSCAAGELSPHHSTMASEQAESPEKDPSHYPSLYSRVA